MATGSLRSLGRSDPHFERISWYLFAGSKGAENRIKIIELLKQRPLNKNQVAEIIQLDYRGVRHHFNVLEKNNFITRIGGKYGALYFISEYLEHNMSVYEQIKSKISVS